MDSSEPAPTKKLTEDEMDMVVYQKALEDYRKNPVTYSLNEIEQQICH